jgi:hypothetical protein
MPALGRLVEHDERSRLYQAVKAATQRSVLWGHHAPVLDQGDLGSCTGNATAQLINTDFFAKSRKSGAYLAEQDAVQIYELATRLDGIPGNTYPPTDGGSSGIGAAKAGVNLHYFTGYKHTFGFDHFCLALQTQPVIVGTSWYEGMFRPDRHGVVRMGGAVAGGHEYLALGISYERKTLTFLNSWGSSWGIGGRFHMSFNTFNQLLNDQGDVTAPVGVA